MSQAFDQLCKNTEAAEGCREHPYLDTATPPRLTVGIGRNLEDQPLTGKEWRELWEAGEITFAISAAGARRLLQSGLRDCLTTCAIVFTWWASTDDVRRNAIAELCYQLGQTRLMGFRKMLAAMTRRDYDSAANELLDSRYATQVPARAKRLAAMIRTGVMP